MNITLDDWQKEFLGTKGDRVLCCGRQIGKSVICGKDGGEYAANNKNKVVLMIAPTERQAHALFDKTLNYLIDNYKNMIKRGKDRPTLTRIKLKNNTIIWCLPVGMAGLGIRFLTVHRLYADEASRIPDPVWDAVTPMLLTTGGDSIYLSTPAGPKGYFADVVNNKDNAFKSFTRFEEESEKVLRKRKICETWTVQQLDKALEHLKREKARMTKRAFAQEYLGKIVADLRRFFSDKLIEQICILKRRERFLRERTYFLGVDIARMGEDESTFEIIDRTDRDNLVHVENEVTTHTLTTETTKKILLLEDKYGFKQIFVDDGGMGVGVFDQLLTDERTRRKTIAINNTSRPLDREEKKRKRTTKENIYNNLLALMEQSKIKLLDDDDLKASLRSVQFEYIDNKIKIWGNYTHIAEGLIRAAWCSKDKSLNIWIA